MTAPVPPRPSIPETVGSAGPAARVVDLSKVYGEGPARVIALDRVTVAFAAGRFTAVMGPSGSGKSTLLHCLAALDAPTGGQVFLGGVEVSALSEEERTLVRRDRIGFVFQAFNLVPTLTAGENIALPARLARRAVDRAWVDHVVAAVGLGDRLSHRPAELSGGQQQRVAIARALAGRPQVVVADEPTGNLDSRAGAQVLGLLRGSVDRDGQTVVMVTHDPTAAAYADRVVFVADGRAVDELAAPTTVTVLDRLAALDPAGDPR